MANKVLFVIGSYNAEMAMAKKILAAVGMPYTAATKGGQFVKSNAAAYKADGMKKTPEVGQKVCFIECKVEGVEPLRVFEPLSRNPKLDLGSPEFYWGSSAIGQLVSALIGDSYFGGGKDIAEKLAPLLWEARLAAASEHYLSAAYRGQCPGVNPTALRLWRAMNRAEYMKDKKPRELMEEAEAAVAALNACPVIELKDGLSVINVEHYIPEMYEAAAIIGSPIMYARFDKKAEKTKVTLLNGTPLVIEAWLEWAKGSDSGLNDVYGSPDKGYAGGFKA